MNVISRRVRCLVSEVLTECDLEDVVRHNLYRVEEGLIRKPYLLMYSTINGYHYSVMRMRNTKKLNIFKTGGRRRKVIGVSCKSDRELIIFMQNQVRLLEFLPEITF